MKYFTDNKNRRWEITINVSSLRRVRDALKVDLVEMVTKGFAGVLGKDPILLGDLLYVLCKPQLDAAKVSDEEFGESLAGDAIESATSALLEEIVDFFPSSRRKVLAATMEKAKTVSDQLIDRAMERVKNASVEQLVKESEKALTPSNGSATNSEGSAESIPDR